jgi:ABC-type polysaccharide/polyol phosphate transport system ATPase subunit
MAQPVIELNNVSKRYRLRRGWHVKSIRDEVERLAKRLIMRGTPTRDDFWALKDVTFALEKGEVLGLVGRNGAGKSTLLKILSHVTVPTTGSFVARGRLGALIEIGAGFHPELTGRENVFLNGSIMGMSRREVQEKFDRIVAFAEIERFIDTPIKHYSSGQQMRLGFSVAAHVDPEILLIDEILAVGDASFQAKCLNKLAELKEDDKTIILVSHNLSNITDYAKRVVWLDGGSVRMIGEANEVVDAYLEHVTSDGVTGEAKGTESTFDPDRDLAIGEVVVRNRDEVVQDRFDRGETVLIDVSYAARRAMPGAVFVVSIQDLHGYPLGGIATDPDSMKVNAAVEQGVLRLKLDPILFTKGAYTLSVHAMDPVTKRYYDIRRRAARILVDGHRATSREASGHIHYPHQWEHIR